MALLPATVVAELVSLQKCEHYCSSNRLRASDYLTDLSSIYLNKYSTG